MLCGNWWVFTSVGKATQVVDAHWDQVTLNSPDKCCQQQKKVTYQIDIKRTINRSLILAIADGTVSVDGREIYTAEGLRVGLFTSTDSF